jgi:hypothetical protein
VDSVAVLTAVYDGYDTLKELPAQSFRYEAICLTDDPDLKSDSWDVRVYDRRPAHPNVQAKWPKVRPWDYTDARYAVWLDASFRVISHDFLREIIEFAPFAQWSHPARDCYYDEAVYSAGMGKYADLPLIEQADAYRDAGMPDHWGLWATGCIVREREPNVEAFGCAWFEQIVRWGYQDQVSYPYVLREYGLRPDPLPGSYMQNHWLRYEGSARH